MAIFQRVQLSYAVHLHRPLIGGGSVHSSTTLARVFPTPGFPLGSVRCPFESSVPRETTGSSGLDRNPSAVCMLPCHYLHNWDRKLVRIEARSFDMSHLRREKSLFDILHVFALVGTQILMKGKEKRHGRTHSKTGLASCENMPVQDIIHQTWTMEKQ